MGIRGRVYVPTKTPKQKRDRIRYHGREFIELIAVGATYDLAAAAALDDVARTGATLIPPYDDLRTMAGQGTIAAEILDQLDVEPDLVIVPVGGGGCISGITTYMAERTTNTAVLGVEPAGAAAMIAALAAGEPVTLDHVDQFVDGAAVNRAGILPFAALTAAGDMVSLTTVDEGAVCTAMLDLYQNEGIIAEPAGALAVAGLLEATVEPGTTVVCLISGGNNDVSRYNEILERSLVHLGLKHYFLVDFPQEPGALRRFLDEVLGPSDDITLFEYVKRNNRETGEALVGIQLGSAADLDGLLVRMRRLGHACRDPGAGLAGLPLPDLAAQPTARRHGSICTRASSLARKIGSMGRSASAASPVSSAAHSRSAGRPARGPDVSAATRPSFPPASPPAHRSGR